MAKLAVSIAGAAYDRTWPIIDGRVTVEGCDVTFVTVDPSEAFVRAYTTQDFDVTELSFSSHIVTTARGTAPYIAIPAFISRVFRHSAFYVRSDRGIETPADLRGRIVGVPEYQMTAALWARGLLSDEYGVKSHELRWRTGGLDQPGLTERTPIALPPDFDLSPIPSTATLSDMLARGGIDALISARAPACVLAKVPQVRRLFPDIRGEEETYYRRTGMFPIMHLVGVRRSLVEAHPWLALNLYRAFASAKDIALNALQDDGIYYASLPWLSSDVARAVALMGSDFWPYGMKANRKEIDAMLRWAKEQGLAQRILRPDEVFAPGTLDT